MDSRTVFIPLAILTATILIANQYRIQKQKSTFEDPDLLKRGLNTPTIWIFINDTDVNSRLWTDFGSRSSRVYNIPFLNLCYESIVKAAGLNYHVEVIGGIEDAQIRLGGVLPGSMSNKRIPLRSEEMTYLKVAFLEKFGGLWMSPATICLKELPVLPKDKVVLFGSDPLETYAGPEGTELPNQHAMWSPSPNHPFFQKWKKNLKPRINEQRGGREVRNDSRWDIIFAGTDKSDVVMMPHAELTRKAGGRKIELEDLLASGTGGDFPFEIPPESLYVPFPWPELLERRIFGWFLRLSEQEIKESDLVATHLFRMAGI
jgi:hypothetical protein